MLWQEKRNLLKVLYLATFEAAKKWTTTIRNWGQVYGELSIMYEERMRYAPKNIFIIEKDKYIEISYEIYKKIRKADE